MNDTRKHTTTRTLGELFTREEIEKAFEIIRTHNLSNAVNDLMQLTLGEPAKSLNELLIEHVVGPAMPRINEKTAQPNSPEYFAYVLQYAYVKTQENKG